MADDSLQVRRDPVSGGSEQTGHQTKGDPRGNGEEQVSGDLRNTVYGVMNAPEQSDAVGNDRREQTRDERVVPKFADGKNLEAEDRSCERRSENRSKARGHAGHQ